MPKWISWEFLLLAAIPIGVVLLVRRLGRLYPAVMHSMWLRGVTIPLALVGLTVIPWIATGQWYWVGILYAIMIATIAWGGRAVARDRSPPRWGSRSDILGRLVLVVYAAGIALIGLESSHTPFGRTQPHGAYTYYAIAIGMLVAAVVMKPAWLRTRTT
jgi:hypothetical protein